MGINCNPDCDTISHEAYGTFANDLLDSSLGQDFLQQFVSGWCFVKSSYSSGVEESTKKAEGNVESSTMNTVTQVINGARTIVTNAVARCKSSRNPRKSLTQLSVPETLVTSRSEPSTSNNDNSFVTEVEVGEKDILVLIDRVCCVYISKIILCQLLLFCRKMEVGI